MRESDAWPQKNRGVIAVGAVALAASFVLAIGSHDELVRLVSVGVSLILAAGLGTLWGPDR